MKKLLTLFILTATLLSPIALSSTVSAQFDPLKPTCDEKVGSGGADEICETPVNPEDPITGDDGIISRVANLLALIAAVIAVIVIIIAGITMMTSQGDAGKVSSSRNTIIYTAVGLIVIVLARTIVVYVFGSL